jgi:dimethylargininase
MSVSTEQIERTRSQPKWVEATRLEGTKPRFAALTRGVSGNLSSCELTYKQREPIDCSLARQQFNAYCEVLRRWGIDLTTLPASDSHPDCCFVQDTAVVLDEISITASMGAASRSGETKEVEKVLSQFRAIARITPPATLDGGDVVQFGNRLFVGLSRRTNGRGIEALQRIVEPRGYRVVPVVVNGGLHLTTGCGVVNDETVLLNPRWLDATAFKDLRQLHVPETEPWAANTIRLNGAVCLEAGAAQTAELVSPFTETIETLDISEFRKAEGSLSCLSLIFKDQFCD